MADNNDDGDLYHPLETNQIRLMRMHHTESPDIECSLATFSIDSCPDYIALSYRWREEKASFEVLVSGRIVLVPPNLYAYLQLMKEEGQEDWTFIDFLCINQNDIVERGHQVSLMRQVYQNAAEVVAWMGTKPDLRDGDSIEAVERTLAALQNISRDRGWLSTRFVIEDAVSRGLIPYEELFEGEAYSLMTLVGAYDIRIGYKSASSARLELSKYRWEFAQLKHAEPETRRDAIISAETAFSRDLLRIDDFDAEHFGPSHNSLFEVRWREMLRDWMRGAVPYGGVLEGQSAHALEKAIVEVPEEYIYQLAVQEYPGDELSYYIQAMITAFLQRDYWSRAWIIQEVASARQLTLRFRSLRLPSVHFTSLVGFVRDIVGFDDQYSTLGNKNDSSGWRYECEFANRLLTGSTIPREQREEIRCMLIPIQLIDTRKFLHESLPNTEQQYRKINLLMAVCNWSRQECTQRFDCVFGILGLTNSQLQPSYTMSSLELYLRIMTEGILESDRNDAEEDPFDHLINKHFFCTILLSVLHLDIWHPVVALTTRVISALCKSSLLPPASAQVDARVLARSNFLMVSTNSRVAARLRTAATLQQLKSMPDNHVLKSPCSGLPARSVKNWRATATFIFADVLIKAVGSRGKRAESEGRRLESLTSELKDMELAKESKKEESVFMANMRHSANELGSASEQHRFDNRFVRSLSKQLLSDES